VLYAQGKIATLFFHYSPVCRRNPVPDQWAPGENISHFKYLTGNQALSGPGRHFGRLGGNSHQTGKAQWVKFGSAFTKQRRRVPVKEEGMAMGFEGECVPDRFPVGGALRQGAAGRVPAQRRPRADPVYQWHGL